MARSGLNNDPFIQNCEQTLNILCRKDSHYKIEFNSLMKYCHIHEFTCCFDASIPASVQIYFPYACLHAAVLAQRETGLSIHEFKI